MKIEVLTTSRRSPNESRSLIIVVDYHSDEGYTIAEKCYPGIWVSTSLDVVDTELLPESHPYFQEAVPASTYDISDILTYVGGRKGAEKMLMEFIEKVRQDGIEFTRSYERKGSE